MKKICFLCVTISFFLNAFSQDPGFLNTNQSLISINPSFAGSNGFIRNQFSYRNQWTNLSHNFVSYLNSFDAYIKPVKGGIAFSAFHSDQSSIYKKSSVYSLSYAQHLSLLEGKVKIIPSLQFSYGERKVDLTKLTFEYLASTGNPVTWAPDPAPSPQRNYFDVSSGILINYNKNLYLGASVFHINQPDVGLQGPSKLHSRLSLYASYTMFISDQAQVQFLYNHQSQRPFNTDKIIVNMVSFDHLVIGLGYVNFEGAIVNAGYRNNYFAVVLGYNVTFSRLTGNTADTWELHSSFNLRNKEQRKTLATFESW